MAARASFPSLPARGLLVRRRCGFLTVGGFRGPAPVRCVDACKHSSYHGADANPNRRCLPSFLQPVLIGALAFAAPLAAQGSANVGSATVTWGSVDPTTGNRVYDVKADADDVEVTDIDGTAVKVPAGASRKFTVPPKKRITVKQGNAYTIFENDHVIT